MVSSMTFLTHPPGSLLASGEYRAHHEECVAWGKEIVYEQEHEYTNVIGGDCSERNAFEASYRVLFRSRGGFYRQLHYGHGERCVCDV
jgi:hypothetical protein